jgi:hypothetical protein
MDAEIKNFVENTFEDNKRDVLNSTVGDLQENNNEKLLAEALINEVIHELNEGNYGDQSKSNNDNGLQYTNELESPKLLLKTLQSTQENKSTIKDIPDIEDLSSKQSKIDEQYIEETDGSKQFQQTITEIQENNPGQSNIKIVNYFTESDDKQDITRQFTEVVSFSETIYNIVKAADAKQPKDGKDQVDGDDKDYKKQISRTSSLSSINSSVSNSDVIHPPRKHGKKSYGVDKYFATNLYRTAHARTPSLRSSENVSTEDISGASAMDEKNAANIKEAIDILNDFETLNDDIENDPNLKAEFWRNYLKDK